MPQNDDWERIFTAPEHQCLVEMLREKDPGGQDHSKPARIQKLAVPLLNRVVEGGNGDAFMMDAPTGFGKTAAFTLPILAAILRGGNGKYADKRAQQLNVDGPQALVLVQNRDLAFQHMNKIGPERDSAGNITFNGYVTGVLDTYGDG